MNNDQLHQQADTGSESVEDIPQVVGQSWAVHYCNDYIQTDIYARCA